MNKHMAVDFYIDITDEVCPFTFVRTKLRLERMASGEVLEVRLKGAEPLANVPASAAELGHTILSIEPEPTGGEDIRRVRIRKA
ncbi:MAG: sulfurtransferase TusA family protein [Inquilinaceae bacterium]